jgi:microcystin-dependent protein
MVDLVPNARQQFLDLNQAPLVGGLVYMYIPNTTIFKTTFQDQAGTIPNQNPIILDDIGSAAIWGSGLYRQVVTDSLGNLLWDALTNPPGELNSTGTNAGCVVWFASSVAPAGFLECNGQAVSRTNNNLLFAAIGTQWGIGDGSTTFNVPDLRGEFIRAWDDGKGIDPGRVFGSTQADSVNQSSLTVTAGNLAVSSTITGTLTLPGSPGAGTGAESGGQTIGKDGTYTATVAAGALTAVNTVSGAPTITAQTETRPKNIALLPCISTGAGPGTTTGGQTVLALTQVATAQSPYTILPTDSLILTNSGAGAIVLNAPAVPVPGRIIYVKDSNGSANVLHSVTFSFPVDTLPIQGLSSPFDRVAIFWNGANWSFLQ